jgi:D-alanyl-D-alanine carboxypeptidase (penicillin-binding protein 5/6)
MWPDSGQSAAGIVGNATLVTHSSQTPVPTASTAKLITALVVLHERPLTLGKPGPTLTLTDSDAALYNSYTAQGGSVVPVTTGEQISEYQVLQTMLLPSANNMADSLAIWAFGSLHAYNIAATAYLSELGLSHTHIGTDASGFAPSTTSTAHDLVRLGELAMQNPVLSQIVGQSTASGLPLVNTVKNINWLLGTSHIIGIKTGNTDQAGGVFISASRVIINQQPVTIVTAVAGMPTLSTAMKVTLPLVQSAQANFQPVTVIRAGSILGHYHSPWGSTLSAVAGTQMVVSTWNGSSLVATVKLNPLPSNAQAGQTVGRLTIPKSAFAGQQSVPVNLSTALAKPSLWWRLLHPF